MAYTLPRGLLRILPGSGRAAPADARTFAPAAEGSGIFGRWTLDAHGLPAYEYTLDQWRDGRARYANSEHLNRRDHWHQIGNDRITALAGNDGTVQVYLGDRGGVWLNRFEARDCEAQPDAGASPPGLWLFELAARLLYAAAGLWRRLRAWWFRLRSAGIQRRQHEAVVPRGATTLPVEKPQAAERLAVIVPHAYAGGYAYLDDGQEVWASAYRYRPAAGDVTRVFGIGRCETTAVYRNIRVARQTYAPPGDDALLLSDVRIDNLGKTAVDLRYYEYWDVNIQRLQLQWLRTGSFAAGGDEARRALNDDYAASVSLDEQWRILRYRQQLRNGAPQSGIAAVSDVDRLPYDVFLANLSENRIAACYTDKSAFFGGGGAAQPDAVRARGDAAPAPHTAAIAGNAAMPYCAPPEPAEGGRLHAAIAGDAAMPSCAPPEPAEGGRLHAAITGNAAMPYCAPPEPAEGGRLHAAIAGNAAMPYCAPPEPAEGGRLHAVIAGNAAMPYCAPPEPAEGGRLHAAITGNAAMPYCLVMRHDIHLEPGAGIDLRFAYGAARPDDPLKFIGKYRAGDILGRTVQCWKERLVYFLADGDRTLQRETAWHAHNLLAATVRNDYYGAHTVPQGSAYLYLHGADGAPRDHALAVLPLVYVRPELAREMLLLLLSLMRADSGALPYAFAGYGAHSSALGVHAAPSDLDLFLLLALNEYLAASGDAGFLNANVPYYPRGALPAAPRDASVLDHVRLSLKHLLDVVGTGENGLLRIGDGDWSDSIVIENVLQNASLRVNLENTRAHGESVPNSQMALYVLPRVAAWLERHDPQMAARVRVFTAGLEKAVMLQWNGRWFARAVLRDLANYPVVIADDWINLEAQPWALISGAAARMGRQGVEQPLIDMICRLLDDPSPIGAPLNERGMVWPAISQLLTWAYTRSRPDLAWRSLRRNTFAARSRAFPAIWHGVWSGSDGIYGIDHASAGQTWANAATPMTDFPVMNLNPDAMALLGLLRVCGVEPAPEGDGLSIAPAAPPERFTLDTQLLRLDVAPGHITGEYRAAAAGSLKLRVRVPPQALLLGARVGGAALAAPLNTAGEAVLPLVFSAGQRIPFEVAWSVR